MGQAPVEPGVETTIRVFWGDFGIMLIWSHRPKSTCTVSGRPELWIELVCNHAVYKNDLFYFESICLIWIKIPMPCSFSIGITWICYIPFLCLWPKYTRFFRGTNTHLTATAIHFIWKAFVGHHVNHSTRFRSNTVCCKRLLFLQKLKGTNRENQKKYLLCENRFFKAPISVI